MDMQKLAKKLDGIYTIETIEKQLEISKRTAINYASLLKKQGYAIVERGKRGKRLYTISPIRFRASGNPGLYETINKFSKIKISAPYKTFIHDKKLSVEEAIIEAVKTGDYRVIIAAILLFKHIKSWSLLLKFAKENRVQNKVGALYDLARTIIRTKRIDKRTENALMKHRKKAYLISGVKNESDFKAIGKKWNVIIGISKQDLWRLKE